MKTIYPYLVTLYAVGLALALLLIATSSLRSKNLTVETYGCNRAVCVEIARRSPRVWASLGKAHMMMRNPKVGVAKMVSKAYVCEIINQCK